MQDIPGVAKRSEVKEVAHGYALNFLFPQGLAVRATPEREQALRQHTEGEHKTQSREVDRAHSLAGELKDKTVTIACPASSTGTLYAAIAPELVVQAVQEQLKVRLQPSQVLVPPHVKTIGGHQVQVLLHPEVKITLTLHITPH